MPSSTEPQSGFDGDPQINVASTAVDSLRALRNQRILQWCVRSAITGTLLWWISTKYEWVRVLFYIWAVIALLSLLALVLLPSLVGNRIRAMEQAMMEDLDLGGAMGSGGLGSTMASPRDIDVDAVMAEDGHRPLLSAPSVPECAPVPLEEQLAELEHFGIRLNDQVSVDDLCYSFDQSFLESRPYDALLFLLGSEAERDPWGRHFTSSAWALDSECIDDEGSYAEIVANLARISGKLGRLEGLQDFVDLEGREAWVRYSLDGHVREYRPEVRDDWVDPATLQAIVEDFADEELGFYGIENGQGTLIYCLRREHGPGFEALVPHEVMEIA